MGPPYRPQGNPSLPRHAPNRPKIRPSRPPHRDPDSAYMGLIPAPHRPQRGLDIGFRLGPDMLLIGPQQVTT